MLSNAEAALGYAKQGWKIFPCHWPVFKEGVVSCSCDPWRIGKTDKHGNPLGPCKSIGKHPITYTGFHEATTNIDKVYEWWERKPFANIGMPGGPDNGIFVLDVDPDHGGDKTLAALEEKHGALPPTRRAITGSGGEHILFNHIPDLSNSVGALGDGLDTRTDGGYIVVAPSLHRSGRRYEWANQDRLADAPEWLVQLIIGPGGDATPGGGQSGYWGRIAGGVREGERHVMILKLSGLLLGDRRIEPILALALVRGFNKRSCVPPLPEGDVDERFHRILKKQRAFHER